MKYYNGNLNTDQDGEFDGGKSEMTTHKHITCPCCATSFSAVDAPEEYKRVASWSPGSAMGKRNKGRKRHISEATRAARIEYLAKWRADNKAQPKGSEL